MSGDPLRVIGGMLLVLFGLCILLAGGLCTFVMLMDLRSALMGGGAFAIITLSGLFLGVLAVVQGIRIMTGRG